MSLLCNIDICKFKSCALCYCCYKNLCFNHLKEHHDLIQLKLNSLVNEINILNEQLIIFNKDNQNLYQENYDQYFTKQIEKFKKNLVQLQSKIIELIDKQDTTNEDIHLLTLMIQHVKQEIEMIKQGNISPFITEEFIFNEQSKTNDFNLSSPFQTIICKNPLGSALACSNQRLLSDQRLNLHLFDQNLTFIKQYKWINGLIRDICWSSTLNKFISTTNNKEIYLINENLTSIESIQTIEQQEWCSCTCSDTYLFITTNYRGTNIFQFNISSIFELIKQWKPPYSCQQHELIHDIIYNKQKLALIIEDSFSNMIHIELRLSDNLNLVWSFRPDIKYNLFQPAIRCCSLKYDEWLIIDSNNSRLFHINNHGEMKDSYMYKSPPWNAILLNSNIIVIRTENTLNFHQVY